MARELNLSGLLEVLARHDVTYVLIGGIAAVAHGSPFPTEDLDIAPATELNNLDRLSTALAELDARVRVEDESDGLPFVHDAESLAAVRTWNLTTTYGDLDINLVPDGTAGYADLDRSAGSTELFGIVVRVASLADVIRSKQAANRPKDQRVLPTLRDILGKK